MGLSREAPFFFKRKIPLYFFALAIPLTTFFGYMFHPEQKHILTESYSRSECVTSMEQIRLQKLKFAQPLLLTDVKMEDARFNSMKIAVNFYISSTVVSGKLTTASVYVRHLKDGAWMGINEQEHYSPGSLLKVPLMIHYLKAAEKNPSLMKEKIFFQNHFTTPRLPIFTAIGLTPGTTYSVQELLRSMIVDSDNDATVLLDSYVNNKISDEVYENLGLDRPNPTEKDYPLTVQECARFFRVLFNATYLSPEMSDYALKLLAESTFKDGMVKKIDSSVTVSHKFAERGSGDIKEFHEVGIVYLKNDAYLIGVMTKGRELKELTNIVSDISKIVYDEMQHAVSNF